MKNEIHKVRAEVERILASAWVRPEEQITELSPSGRYQLEINAFATADFPDYGAVAVASVCRTATGEVVATINRNDAQCFYGWVERDGHEYLLFSEDLEGQSITDLTTQRTEGFSSPEETFIWTEFHPSPDKTMLAVLGCYWACPYQTTIYDFRDPLTLPLPIVAQFELPGNDAKFGEWVSATSFTAVASDGSIHLFEFR